MFWKAYACLFKANFVNMVTRPRRTWALVSRRNKLPKYLTGTLWQEKRKTNGNVLFRCFLKTNVLKNKCFDKQMLKTHRTIVFVKQMLLPLFFTFLFNIFAKRWLFCLTAGDFQNLWITLADPQFLPRAGHVHQLWSCVINFSYLDEFFWRVGAFRWKCLTASYRVLPRFRSLLVLGPFKHAKLTIQHIIIRMIVLLLHCIAKCTIRLATKLLPGAQSRSRRPEKINEKSSYQFMTNQFKTRRNWRVFSKRWANVIFT